MEACTISARCGRTNRGAHRCYASLAALLLACGHAVAADVPLFVSDEPIDVVIEAPLRALLNDRSEEPEYRVSQLRYTDKAGVTHSLDIGLRPRGKTRRQPDKCKFPPLRLNFKSSQVTGTVFEGQDKLKLVTHCQNKQKVFQQYLLQEYLAYKILNLFTEQSFRVRLLNVTYQSTDSNKKPLTRHAFLIEHHDDMASRNGKTVQKLEKIGRHQLDAEAVNIVEVFQYLIGNTDWSSLDGPGDSRCCHNAVLIARDDGPFTPVPYDFDYAGIINAPYALPGKSIRIKTVRTRVYRGYCRPSDILDATLVRFRQQKNVIYDLYRQQAGLSSLVKKSALSYLDDFYKTIDNPARLERKIVSACRGAL